MKKISWKRIVITMAVLCAFCLLCIITGNIYFFIAGLAVAFVIIAAAFIR